VREAPNVDSRTELLPPIPLGEVLDHRLEGDTLQGIDTPRLTHAIVRSLGVDRTLGTQKLANASEAKSLMGSCMSGRHGRRSDATFADDLLCLNLAAWRKRGRLQPRSAGFGQCKVWCASGRVLAAHAEWDLEDRQGSGYLRLRNSCELTVELCATSQPLGGVRWWIVCPLCEGRCGKLYCEGYGRWGCRRRLELRYRTQHLGRALRARADKYFERLGTFRWVAIPRRPRGMHLSTFGRLRSLAALYEKRWIALGVMPLEADTRRFRQK
jgi:hypothetical protein